MALAHNGDRERSDIVKILTVVKGLAMAESMRVNGREHAERIIYEWAGEAWRLCEWRNTP